MNYYERHLGDYAKDTAHLTMIEHGAYGLLLDRYYGTEAGIPADQVHRIARARTREEKHAVDVVLAEFFQLAADGIWINKRAEEEIAKAQVKIKVAQENGKSGGRPRKNQSGSENETQQKPSGFYAGSENETQQKAHQAPSTKHQTPEVNQAAAIAEPPRARETPPAAASPPADPIHVRACELTALVRSRGARLNASNPDVRRWAESGVTDAQLLTAFDVAEERRATKGDSSPVNAGLLNAILRDTVAPQQARASPMQRHVTRDESRAIAASTRLSDFRNAVAADRGQIDECTLEAPTAS